MAVVIPDFDWYAMLSRERGVPPRCPFANVHRCPRYYSSLWLMGKHGGATEIDSEIDKIASKKWHRSDLAPVVREQEPSASGSDSDWSFSKLCPEVAYDRFGWFASGLYTYGDEIDQEYAHARLGRDGDNGESWRWAWASVNPMHYTECPLYSLLLERGERESEKKADLDDEILQLRPNLYGISLNLKALFSRVRKLFRRNG